MNKRLIISLSVIGVVAAIAIGGTVAFFSDTETSTGNTFTAGELDLTIDNTSYYNGALNSGTTWTYQDPIGLFFDFHDLKPGDWGEDTISVHVDTNDAWACMDFYLYNADDNGLSEPEAEVDTTDGPGRGELQDTINFIWWKDDGDNVLEQDEDLYQGITSLSQLNTFSVPLADATGDGILSDGALVGEEDYFIGKAWCFGELSINAVPQEDNNSPTIDPGFDCDGTVLDNLTQSDGVQGTLSFRAVQARHNDDFTCDSLCSVISFLDDDNFEGVDDPIGWSTGDGMVDLNQNSWSLLGGTATVYGYKNGDPYDLSHRGTRGLGVIAGENDEVDGPERIEIVFDNPVLVNMFEVRSLFDETTGAEEGIVELYSNSGTVLEATYQLTGVELTGGDGVLSTLGANIAVDTIVFYVPDGYNDSEFAVAKARVCPAPVVAE
jgi:predicted ribosomally synthesized peptide with SipW-like signal peptide